MAEEKLSLDTFAISPTMIDIDTALIEDRICSCLKRKIAIEKNFHSIHDFVGIYYYLHFVCMLEKSEIAERLGFKVVNVHGHFYLLGWEYSKIYSKNLQLYTEHKNDMNALLQEALSSIHSLSIDGKLKSAIELGKQRRSKQYLKYGFSCEEDFIKVLYYVHHIKEKSTHDLLRMFDVSFNAIADILRSYDLNLDHEKGIERKRKNKSQNYLNTIISGKRSRLNSQSRNSSLGTKIENKIRNNLSNWLYTFFDGDIYEMIVGVNNTGILDSKEADIPLIIHNIPNDLWFKFVVEYNGPFHNQDDDSNKEALALCKGWTYIPIYESNYNCIHNDILIEDRVCQDVCRLLKEIITSK